MPDKMFDEETLVVADEHSGKRLDAFLASVFQEHSRTRIQGMIRDGLVKYDLSVCLSPKTPVAPGAQISVTFPVCKAARLEAEDIPLDKLFEDEHILIINKASGLVVHPAAGNYSGTIVNALMAIDANFAENMDDHERPGIVHRLDKDTSGCLIIAKTPSASQKLISMFSQKMIKKTYLAITYGHPPAESGEIRGMIGRHPVHRKKMSVLEKGGKEAESSFKLISHGNYRGFPVAVLEVEIKTGRTHQIRIHLAHIKCPVLGDTVYGGKQKIHVPRQMLHAWRLSFLHPCTGKKLEIEAPPPKDFLEVAANSALSAPITW